MDCDSFVLSIRTDNVINDLKNLEDLFDFRNLNKDHQYSVITTKKLLANLK